LWATFSNPAHRRGLLQEGWKAVSKVLVIALVLDSVYQYIVFHWFYQVEALIVALTLAILPYVLIRGPLNRTARRWLKTKY